MPAEKITPTALLQKDLDLDSIDAVDLVVYLQDWTGREVPEEALRAVRTVDDVVSMVETHLAGGPAPGGPPPGAAGSEPTASKRRDAGASATGSRTRPSRSATSRASWGQLLADAALLARDLPAGAAAEVMVACADRYLCAVALLAVWHGGRSAALPPNSRQETIDGFAPSAASPSSSMTAAARASGAWTCARA